MIKQPAFSQGARPIRSMQIQEHYQLHQSHPVTLHAYIEQWRHWLIGSATKSLIGLQDFVFADYTQGTTQTFDQFVLRHAGQRDIVVLRGEFQYHTCITKKLSCVIIDKPQCIRRGQALIISAPFSDYGSLHPAFDEIMSQCMALDVPVCLDLAYWGIARNINIDLQRYTCIQEVTASLSKSFFTLENHRIGVRFSRLYLDDGISMINEVGMQNFHSMSLALHYMQTFCNDWNWLRYGERYEDICVEHSLRQTNTVIFGLSSWPEHSMFNRGIRDNHRICISTLLTDLI